MIPCVLILFLRQSDLTIGHALDTDVVAGLSVEGETTHQEKIEELKRQVAELETIKMSALNELSELELRLKQAKDASTAPSKYSKGHSSKKSATFGEENEDYETRTSKVPPLDCPPPPSVAQPPPIVILSQLKHTTAVKDVAEVVDGHDDGCSFPACFDYSRCPLTQPFRVYVYGDHASGSFPFDHATRKILVDIFNSTSSLATRPQDSCLLVAAVDTRLLDATSLEGTLLSLPHWGNDGSNHVLVGLHTGSHNIPRIPKLEKAIIVTDTLQGQRVFRPEYDILLPTLPSPQDNTKLTDLPSILPELRKFLLYFGGSLVFSSTQTTPLSPAVGQLSTLEALKIAMKGVELVAIDTTCLEDGVTKEGGASDQEWTLCGDHSLRIKKHAQSTFSLVLPGNGDVMGGATFTRLLESLQSGSVPVVVGVSVLPLDDVINWSRVVIFIPPARLGEIHYILRSIAPNSVVQYRLQGRMIWHSYFTSVRHGLSAVVALLRQRTGHPPPLVPDYTARTVVSTGPTAETVVSPPFVQNWTVYVEDIWNRPPGPFHTYPLTPYKPVPLSGTQYEGVPSLDLKLLPPHIVEAGGTTGIEFENYLLGNTPVEHFTIVMLTYQRNDVLLEALKRLQGLRYLAKVVVIWNNEEDPSDIIQWPDIGVRVEVVSVGVNSLNNRFLPLTNIQTEAILSLDDDVYLRHDEIQFAFRVWRENRDRLVGFPGRFHVWDVRHGGWLYNSNYTCELSMVLTGAAFYHKYYSYLYTYWLPREIRSIVDEYMNCEDIAMNFLVSYITKKPPVKVTSRWTFRCPGCPETLSKVESHFDERHMCLNRFTKVIGHMPLLFTQYRADSVLFKTKLPSHLHKCYEYI